MLILATQTSVLHSIDDIYHQHKDRVYNLCLNYVQNVEDAEELSQDTFVKVFQLIAIGL